MLDYEVSVSFPWGWYEITLHLVMYCGKNLKRRYLHVDIFDSFLASTVTYQFSAPSYTK